MAVVSQHADRHRPGPAAGRRILVTGASGFIGRHLVEELLRQGVPLRVLLRPGRAVPDAWAQAGTEACHGDLEEPASLEPACRGIEAVLHAAAHAHAGSNTSAQASAVHWRVNAEGTRHLLDAATGAGVARFVFLSSVKAMGEAGARCVDEDWPPAPQTPYGRSKRAAECWVIDAGRRHGMHAVNLRLPLVYGPGGRGNLERMVAAIRRGRFPPLPEVANMRSLVHVLDVVQAVLLALDQPAANLKTYIVTDGRAYSGREIYELICAALGKPIPAWTVPSAALRALARAGDLLGRLRGRSPGFDTEVLDKLLGWSCYRSDRIQEELGYRASWSLAQALPAMVGAGSAPGGASR